MSADERQLGRMLRAWRDRVDPGEAGISVGPKRRSPGLRREEVAHAAGVSVDYLTRLEQGRSQHPSPQVLSALARTLRLTAAERDHLYLLAGLLTPSAGTVDAHVTPGVQRLVERMRDLPVAVYDARWTLVTSNPLWDALMGAPLTGDARARNLPWLIFLGAPARVRHSPEERVALESAVVADLRQASARYPRDSELADLVRGLRAESPRFAELWERAEVTTHTADRKTIEHPEVGTITLDCDVLTVQGADLRIVAYSAEAGSPDAAALDLLRVIGEAPLSPDRAVAAPHRP
ncbi:helix-turn-helix domain-containing protein [Rhodococcus oryzae]|uniref:Helix-turn-helix domain-containing protein n=1 Tax=Rhodococcus oryzae TaxID=2571143 RepID=A0ABY2RFN2_9NOCA|nr:helix-turn-helix transcriptional regulator [Rhodococcus oryzae]TJZ75725.1 helix-turn-helix domain-containing protein [Rhodococcus oryzae]